VPTYLSRQSHPPLLNPYLDSLFLNRGVPVDRIEGPFGYLVICCPVRAEGPNLNFLGNASDPLYLSDDLFGGGPLSIGGDKSCERGGPVFDSDADIGGINARLAFEFIYDVPDAVLRTACRSPEQLADGGACHYESTMSVTSST
jgi:hypothetical protein